MKLPPSHRPCRSHPHLYEINTLVWLYEFSQKEKKTVRLGDVPDHEWDVLQAKGFDYIWLMGIWERSPYSQSLAQKDPQLQNAYDQTLPGWKSSDVVGSPYAIRSYRPNPDVATWAQLDDVLEKLHQRNMRLILDFVPNHTAVDHDWIHSHPEYYIHAKAQHVEPSHHNFFTSYFDNTVLHLAHGKDPYFPAWTDTAQLNYFNEATRLAMVEELRTIAQHCDGVRCDMAMLVLNDVFEKTWRDHLGTFSPPMTEFWTEAMTVSHEFVWIAEVYWDLEWTLQQLGFQFTYDKRLYDRLRQSSPREVSVHLSADVSYQNHLVRFLENHDEARSASIFGNAQLPAVATLTATLPGMRLYHQGQLEGKHTRLPVQLQRAKEEPVDLVRADVYERLLHITNEKVFHEGQWQLIHIQSAGDSSFQNLVGYQWRSRTEQKIILVNLGAIESQGYIDGIEPIGLTGLEHSPPSSFMYCDLLTGKEFIYNDKEIVHKGLHIHLAPYDARIFAFACS